MVNKMNQSLEFFGVILFLFWLVVAGTLITSALYGYALLFSASVVLGIACLFFPPAATVTGLVMFLTSYNIASAVDKAFGNLP